MTDSNPTKGCYFCPNCKEPMKNLGNVTGITLASYPPKWDEVYICERDKLKKVVRVNGSLTETLNLRDYKELS